jgi:hypothetical protein
VFGLLKNFQRANTVYEIIYSDVLEILNFICDLN